MNEFSLYVDGDNSDGPKPGTVEVGDLAEVIRALEKAMALPDPDLTKDPLKKVHISLVSVNEGSADYGFATDELSAFERFIYIGRVIAGNEYELLSDYARIALDNLRKKLVKLKAKVTFRVTNIDGTKRDIGILRQSAVIVPSTVEIVGETEIAGWVVDAGGINPNVHVNFLGQDREVVCTVASNIEDKKAETKKSADSLYDWRVFRGLATWDAKTGEIIKFTIHDSSPFVDVSNAQAFAELRTKFGHRFDDIENTEEYIAELRGESE